MKRRYWNSLSCKPVATLFCFVYFLLFLVQVQVQARQQVAFDLPYYLVEKRDSVMPGERFQARIVIESQEEDTVEKSVFITLPPGIVACDVANGWKEQKQAAGVVVLTTVASLKSGYGQWFDLLSLQADEAISPGQYDVLVAVGDFVKSYPLLVKENLSAEKADGFFIDAVEFPLDKDGKKDARIQDKSLVLRDKKLDYLRGLLQGKGASNQYAEAVHPLAYLGVDIANGKREQKLVMVTAQLLDYHTRMPAPGFITPAASGEEAATANTAPLNREGAQALMALSGAEKQRLLLPVYVEEETMQGGRYWLHISVLEGIHELLSYEIPVTIIKKNQQALLTVLLTVFFVLVAVAFGIARLRRQLSVFKTKWLITIALFSTATFGAVNVPSTLIGDFLHVVLGPFSFLITGLFNGVILYMLLISLIMIIPQSGVISLYMLIRLLLAIFAFGHLSILTILSYSLQAVLLEIVFFVFHSRHLFSWKDESRAITLRTFAPFALTIGVADSLSTYTNMQAMTIFYRLFYADWYVFLVVLFNGLIFTIIGVLCGALLGRQVQKIKGD